MWVRGARVLALSDSRDAGEVSDPVHRRFARPSSVVAVLGLAAALLTSGAATASDDPERGPDLRFDLDRSARIIDHATRGGGGDYANRGEVVSRSVLLDELHSHAAPQPQRRLVNALVVQDVRASRLTVTGNFEAAPSAAYPAALYIYVGVFVGDTCSRRALLAGDTVDGTTGGTFYGADENPTTPLTVARSASGAQLTLTATHPAIASQEWDCAYGGSASTTDPPTPYTQFYPEYLEVQEAPELSIDAGPPLQGGPKGKWTTLRVDVRNTGRGDATGATLKAAGKGIKVKPRQVALGTLDDRSTSYGHDLKVKLKGKKPSTLTLTVAADGGWTATQKVRIAHKAKPTKLPSLAGRYWWGWEPVQLDQGWSNVALWFVDEKFVHIGFPSGAGKPKCKKVTKTCKKYGYNAKTGKVKVGSKAGKVTSAGLKLGKQAYYPLSLPKPGSKLSVALVHNDFSGNCLLACTTWTDRLFLTKAGRFTLTRMSIGSIGAPGSGTVVGVVPPDQTGSYKVLSRGRIELRYDDGSRKVRTIGVEHDLRGKPNPGVAGVVLDDINFYWD